MCLATRYSGRNSEDLNSVERGRAFVLGGIRRLRKGTAVGDFMVGEGFCPLFTRGDGRSCSISLTGESLIPDGISTTD